MNVLLAPFNQAVLPMFQFEDVFEHYLPKGGKIGLATVQVSLMRVPQRFP